MSAQLPKEKIQDLCKMFDAYIDSELRPEWLPISTKTEEDNSRIVIGLPSAALAKQHREELKKEARKKKKKAGVRKND